MYTLSWKSQSSHATQDEQHAAIKDAIHEFKAAMAGLYAHGGGMVMLSKNPEPRNEDCLLQWHEGASGGYCSGQAVLDYKPEEDLEECENDGCSWHDENSQELCESCERKALDICFDRLLRDYE